MVKGKRNRTNEEIVAAYKAGSKFAAQDLWEKNRGMIYMIAQRTVPKSMLDDALQEGFLLLLKCADGYDCNHPSGAQFSSWLYRGLRMYLLRWSKHQRLLGSTRVGVETIPLTTKEAASHSAATFDIDDWIEAEEKSVQYERVSRAMRRRLPIRDRDILREHAAGKSLRAIGKEMGLCGERVRQRRDRAVALVRKSLRIAAPVS